MKKTKRFFRVETLAVAVGLALTFGLAWVTVAAEVPPSLKTVLVPVPDLVARGIVRDNGLALVLGKALFWDQQVGSDKQACASCHFHAGADSRAKNQLSPGLLRRTPNADLTFGADQNYPSANQGQTLSRGNAGPNYALKFEDFPLHVLENPANRNSPILFHMNDVVSSQGTFNGLFGNTNSRSVEEVCGDADPSIFGIGGVATRKVEPRNTPTVINAVFNHRNFWDGRANNNFNGNNPFGRRDVNARIVVTQADGTAVLTRFSIDNSSLASQAVGPALSDFEMSCAGRTFKDLGRKLLTLRPLALQKVHSDDSVLGSYRHPSGNGLTASYATLIRQAFHPRYWSAPGKYRIGTDANGQPVLTPDPAGFTQMELNFSFFWGLAIQTYEATLIADSTPFDVFREKNPQTPLPTNPNAVTHVPGFGRAEFSGLQVFMNKGDCIECHEGPEFTAASVSLRAEEAIERMPMALLVSLPRTNEALYDGGFYNIGVVPTSEDLGAGGTDPFGNPLSFARQVVNNKIIDQIIFAPNEFEIFGPIVPGERVAVDGAFKASTLRTAELTGPYFHNGSYATLRQVVEFYNRGGNRRDVDCIDPSTGNTIQGDTTGFGNQSDLSRCSNLDASIVELFLTDQEAHDLVAFLLALTDPRVKEESAPFDHPQLLIPNGHPGDEFSVTNRGNGRATDDFLEIQAVGKSGRTAQGLPLVGRLLNLDPFSLNPVHGQ